jgi:hypothetical protein
VPLKIVELSAFQIGYNANKLSRTIVKHVEKLISEAVIEDVNSSYTINLFVNKKTGEIGYKKEDKSDTVS